MDSVFVPPQLSGSGFAYTRLPRVPHGVFSAWPIGGTYAAPSHLSDAVIAHLRSQHLAQSRLYGSPPTAVAHIPPPPGRARSLARAASRARAAPVNPPAPRHLDTSVSESLFFVSFLTRYPALPGHIPFSRMGQLHISG